MHTVLSALIWLIPQPFRERFGEEMHAQAAWDLRAARDRGLFPGLYCWIATAIDLLGTAVAERLHPSWVPDNHRRRGEGSEIMRDWIIDLNRAVRTLVRAPGFTAAAAGTLALAIGVSAGIFSVVNAVLLQPLPFEDPDRLVYVAASAPGSDLPDEFGLDGALFVQYLEESTQLESLANFSTGTSTLRVGDRVERPPMAFVSWNFFEVMGVEPLIGRLPAENEEGVVVLTHSTWVNWYGSDPNVLGQTPFVSNGPAEVIGVMPADFQFPSEGTTVFLPFEIERTDVTPGRFGLQVVGRMTADADHESVARELATLAPRATERFGGSARYAEIVNQHIPIVRSLDAQLMGDVARPLWVLLGAVLTVLLIACANVANLFSVRAEGRGRDLAVRRALGAGRRQLVRSQMSEAIIISGLAGVAALGLAVVTLKGFLAVVPGSLPRVSEVGITGGTLGFAIGATVFTMLACGLLPALRASAPSLSRLREGGRGATGRRRWGRDSLVVGQTALALVLLIGSGLLFRSFAALQAVDPGYEVEDIFTFQFAPQQEHLTDGPTWAQFHVDFMNRIRALPGVESVGIVENVPLDEGTRGVRVMSREMTDPESSPLVRGTLAGGDYFSTMGISVLAGRGFEDADVANPGNAVISQKMARLLWGDQDPIGRQFTQQGTELWHTVIGVVEDVMQFDFRTEPEPLYYWPLAPINPTDWALTSPGYVVKTSRAADIAPEIRALVREVAPEAPMYRTYTMEGLAERSLAGISFTMSTLGIAAGLALLLGAIGLYGILSYVVAERTREIGVRMALGAEAGRVRRMVVVQGARVVGVGVVLGLGVAFVATRVLASLLFGVAAFDLPTFAATAAVMVGVGVMASYLPARRASSVDPVESLRGT